jgi:CheY-like chemotaxis protein
VVELIVQWFAAESGTSRSKEAQCFDLILVGMLMPRTSGIDLLRELTANVREQFREAA